jgi:hypothetical protein
VTFIVAATLAPLLSVGTKTFVPDIARLLSFRTGPTPIIPDLSARRAVLPIGSSQFGPIEYN